eukprot:m.485071 g.485071  ORF g.485071 m.485071 type:complete len:76 (-) comp72400_c0_seq1:46-273(-)
MSKLLTNFFLLFKQSKDLATTVAKVSLVHLNELLFPRPKLQEQMNYPVLLLRTHQYQCMGITRYPLGLGSGPLLG